jgi:GLPGLI family protein
MKKIFIIFLFTSNFINSQSIYVEYLETRKISENAKKIMPKGILSMMSKSFLYTLEYKNGISMYKNHPKSLNIKPYDTIYNDNGIEKKESLSNNLVEKILYKKSNDNLLMYTQPKRNKETAYVIDKLVDWNWNITDEKKKINQLECKKATSSYKNMNFTAWFTEDIPMDCGPEFINGLPGLVVYVENEFKIWEMKKIINNVEVLIEKPNFENQKIYTMDELENEILGGRKRTIPEPTVTKEGNTTITKTTKVITN